MTKAIICFKTSSGITVFPIFIWFIAFGCKIIVISFHKYLKTIKLLITFIPPAAEPALPPININENKSIFAVFDHCSKSTDANPVEVNIDIT